MLQYSGRSELPNTYTRVITNFKVPIKVSNLLPHICSSIHGIKYKDILCRATNVLL